MLSFSSMSNSLSHSAANTMRPTNVRASVGSSTSGSSASPKRSVCAGRRCRGQTGEQRERQRRRSGIARCVEVMAVHSVRCRATRAASRCMHTGSPQPLPKRRLQRCEPRIARHRRRARQRSARRRDLPPEVARDRVAVRRRRAAASPSAQRCRACGQRVRKRQPGRRVDRARHVALRAGCAARRSAGSGTGIADSSACVYGWRGCGEQRALVGVLDDLPEVHHGDARRDVLDHREVVRDEDVGEAETRAAGRAAG